MTAPVGYFPNMRRFNVNGKVKELCITVFIIIVGKCFLKKFKLFKKN
jgi:hypothetical protein